MKNSNQTLKSALIATLVFMLLAAKPIKPDFSGSWQIDVKKSDFG
ncbi:hypothetical protein [Pedobacter faecalis]|nr:hypothetical protein [Pedobacter sp. ELA7]